MAVQYLYIFMETQAQGMIDNIFVLKLASEDTYSKCAIQTDIYLLFICTNFCGHDC